MLPKKHIHVYFKQIAVFIFFFLNCLLTTVSFTHASVQNNKYSGSAGNLEHNSNTADPIDSNRSNYPEEQEYRFTVLSKQSIPHNSKTSDNYLFSSNNITDISSGHYFASSSFVVRPAYYIFLSLHKLF